MGWVKLQTHYNKIGTFITQIGVVSRNFQGISFDLRNLRDDSKDSIMRQGVYKDMIPRFVIYSFSR